MRNAIGGAWILGVVMVFMVFMIAFVYISIDYNHVYKTKTDIVNVIEEYQGINNDSQKKIYKIVNGNGYIGKNTCSFSTSFGTNTTNYLCFNAMNSSSPGDWKLKKKSDASKYTCAVCISESKYTSNSSNGLYTEHYYSVEIFLKIDLPIFGNIFTYRVPGSTNPIYYPYDKYTWTY